MIGLTFEHIEQNTCDPGNRWSNISNKASKAVCQQNDALLNDNDKLNSQTSNLNSRIYSWTETMDKMYHKNKKEMDAN